MNKCQKVALSKVSVLLCFPLVSKHQPPPHVIHAEGQAGPKVGDESAGHVSRRSTGAEPHSRRSTGAEPFSQRPGSNPSKPTAATNNTTQ